MFLFNFAVIIINCALKYLKNNKFLSQFSIDENGNRQNNRSRHIFEIFKRFLEFY